MAIKLPLAYAQSLWLCLCSVSLLGLIMIFQKDIPEMALFGLCVITGFACGLSAGSLLFPAAQFKSSAPKHSNEPL